MKKTTSKFFTAFVVMACVAMFVSCEKDIKHCTADKPYYCKKFPGHELESEVSFDGLYDEAKIQGAKKMKVRIN